jgi:hypothetical protein
MITDVAIGYKRLFFLPKLRSNSLSKNNREFYFSNSWKRDHRLLMHSFSSIDRSHN